MHFSYFFIDNWFEENLIFSKHKKFSNKLLKLATEFHNLKTYLFVNQLPFEEAK